MLVSRDVVWGVLPGGVRQPPAHPLGHQQNHHREGGVCLEQWQPVCSQGWYLVFKSEAFL